MKKNLFTLNQYFEKKRNYLINIEVGELKKKMNHFFLVKILSENIFEYSKYAI